MSLTVCLKVALFLKSYMCITSTLNFPGGRDLMLSVTKPSRESLFSLIIIVSFPPTPVRVTFNTPNLTYLDYSDNVLWCDYLYADFIHSLLEARIDLALSRRFYCDTEYYAPFITWICNAQILSLSSATVELMCQCFDYWSSNGGFPFFKNLTKLSLQCKNKKGWKLLWNMIKSSRKLETLILKGFQSIRNGGAKVDGSVVKVVEIYGYRGTRREFNQVKRFFQEIESLQVMKVEIDAKVVDDKEKLQITIDLLSLPQYSSKCQIHVL